MLDQSIYYIKARLESAEKDRVRVGSELANAQATVAALQSRYAEVCALASDLEHGLQLLRNSQGIVDKATSV